MSHEILITRSQSTLIFFANPGRSGPQKASAGWYWMMSSASAWIFKKKCFVFWLSGPHGTSNFDLKSLIHSDLNYTNTYSLKEFLIKFSDKSEHVWKKVGWTLSISMKFETQGFFFQLSRIMFLNEDNSENKSICSAHWCWNRNFCSKMIYNGTEV